MNAQFCWPVTPRPREWIRTAILMCNGTLSVEFVNNFCCNYPNTNPTHFHALVNAPIPGRWLRQNLYKILPYVPIRLPCPPAGCGPETTCCPGITLPSTLHATASFGSAVLTYDGSQYWTSGAVSLGINSVKLRFACGSTGTSCAGLTLEYACSADIPPYSNWYPLTYSGSGCSCSPLSITYNPLPHGHFCGGTVGPITVTL